MELQIKNRTILGKKVRALRRTGLIPAEVFGRGLQNQHLSVSEKDFTKIYKKAGEHTVLTLSTEDDKKIPVLISNVIYHPITRKILNIDFHQIRMDEKIQAKIPIEFTGEAPALKAGFILVKVLSEIEIEALPVQLPHRFDVDLSTLENPGQSIHVRDVKIPAGVKILTPPETVIATVTEKAKEEAEAPPTPTEAAPTPEAETVPQTTSPEEQPKE